MWAACNHLIRHGNDRGKMVCQRHLYLSKRIGDRWDGQIKRIGFAKIILEVENYGWIVYACPAKGKSGQLRLGGWPRLQT